MRKLLLLLGKFVNLLDDKGRRMTEMVIIVSYLGVICTLAQPNRYQNRNTGIRNRSAKTLTIVDVRPLDTNRYAGVRNEPTKSRRKQRRRKRPMQRKSLNTKQARPNFQNDVPYNQQRFKQIQRQSIKNNQGRKRFSNRPASKNNQVKRIHAKHGKGYNAYRSQQADQPQIIVPILELEPVTTYNAKPTTETPTTTTRDV